MKKIIMIEGMSCAHCAAHVQKALNTLPGVTAQVDLAEKRATVAIIGEVGDDALRCAVDEAGYEVVSIE